MTTVKRRLSVTKEWSIWTNIQSRVEESP